MSNHFSPETDPFSYEPGTEPMYEKVQEIIGSFVKKQIDKLEAEMGALAWCFFIIPNEDGSAKSELAAYEFLEYKVKPLQEELDTWLDW